MHKITQYLLISIFCLLLILPSIAVVFNIEPAGKLHDKRLLTKNFPPLSLSYKSIVAFPDAFKKYYTDSHGFRKFLTYWNIELLKKYLKLTILKNVITGKDGWFYWGGDIVIEKLRTTQPLSTDELARFKQIHIERYEYCQRMGARYIFLISPNKHSIYPEYLPDWIYEVKETSHLEQVISTLTNDSDSGYIDFRNVLLNAKQNYPVFFKTDTHWNTIGGFFAYQTIMKEITNWLPNINYLELTDFTIELRPKKKRDLITIISLNHEVPNKNLTIIPKKQYSYKEVIPDPFYRTQKPYYPYLQILIHETPNPELPKAVVFHDSAMKFIYPYLSNDFKRVVYIYNIRGENYFDSDIIEYEKPDIVISETGERFLSFIPDNPIDIKASPGQAEAFSKYLKNYSDISKKEWEIFWNTGQGFNANQSKDFSPIWENKNKMYFSTQLPPEVTDLRIDPPSGTELSIASPSIILKSQNYQIKLDLKDVIVHTKEMRENGKNAFIVTGHRDPHFFWSISQIANHTDPVSMIFSASIYPAFFSKIKTKDHAKKLEETLLLSGKNEESIIFHKLWDEWEAINLESDDFDSKFCKNIIEVFWRSPSQIFQEERKTRKSIDGCTVVNGSILFDMQVPVNAGASNLRVDLPGIKGITCILDNLEVITENNTKNINIHKTLNNDVHHIDIIKNQLLITGNDPYFSFNVPGGQTFVKLIHITGQIVE